MSISVCTQVSLPLPLCVQMTRPELLKCVEERMKVKGHPQDYRGRALSADECTEILWKATQHTSTMRQWVEVRYASFWQNLGFRINHRVIAVCMYKKQVGHVSLCPCSSSYSILSHFCSSFHFFSVSRKLIKLRMVTGSCIVVAILALMAITESK